MTLLGLRSTQVNTPQVKLNTHRKSKDVLRSRNWNSDNLINGLILNDFITKQ